MDVLIAPIPIIGDSPPEDIGSKEEKQKIYNNNNDMKDAKNESEFK